MQTFFSSTKVVLGDNATASMVQKYQRVFLVTDQFMHDTGKTSYITDALNEHAVCEIFSNVYPNPGTDVIAQGIEALKAFQPDVVIALGGGSPTIQAS